MRLDQCPLLKIAEWDWDTAAVATDWALEHGLVEDELALAVRVQTPALPKELLLTPMLIRAAFEENINPLHVARPNAFTRGYIDAAIFFLWEERPGWSYYSMKDLAAPTAAKMTADCAAYVKENRAVLNRAIPSLLYAIAEPRHAPGVYPLPNEDGDVDWAWNALGGFFWQARNARLQHDHYLRGRVWNWAQLQRSAERFGPFVVHVDEIRSLYDRTGYVIWH